MHSVDARVQSSRAYDCPDCTQPSPMAVYLAETRVPRSMEEPPADVSEDLAKLPSAFGQQSLGSATGQSSNIKKLNHPDGAWRVRTGDWRSLFSQTGEDFLVAAIGPRRDIYERLPKIRLATIGLAACWSH